MQYITVRWLPVYFSCGKSLNYKTNCSVKVSLPVHLQVICLGAQQNGLPEDYIKKLQAVETNNYTGPSILDEIKKRKNWVCGGEKINS